MHFWGDKGVDWKGINAAAEYIGETLRKYYRIPVSCYKEKFGTVRVYCSFGINSFYHLWRPGWMGVPKWYPYYLDLAISRPIFWMLDSFIKRIQIWGYIRTYKKAVWKWPHLYKNIVAYADWGELFEGEILGYKHSDFWKEVK